MLMELAPGQDLSKHISMQGLEDPASVVFYAANVVLALRHLHEVARPFVPHRFRIPHRFPIVTHC